MGADTSKDAGKGSSRFRSAYSKAQLLVVAADVARAADPGDPVTISQRCYDAARAQAGHPKAPSARQTASRLAMPWAEVLVIALGHKDSNRSLGRRDGAGPDDVLDPELAEDLIRDALITAAVRRGQDTLTPDDYASERDRILKAEKRHYLSGRKVSLPTVGQIEHVAGSWDQALELAGLKARPSTSERSQRKRSATVVEALDLFLERRGGLPSHNELQRFAKAEGFALERRTRPYAEYLDQLREQRAARGLPTPAKVTIQGRPGRPPKNDSTTPGAGEPQKNPAASGDDHVDDDEEASTASSSSPAIDLPRRANRDLDDHDLEAAIRAFLAWLPDSDRPTQRNYRRFCRENPGRPGPAPSIAEAAGER